MAESPDYVGDSDEGATYGFSNEEHYLWVITKARHLLRDNPALLGLEEAGQKYPEYMKMIGCTRAKRKFKHLPPTSEGFRIGKEWPNLEVMPESRGNSLPWNNKVGKIYPPKAYWPYILKVMHKIGKKLKSVLWRTRLHYTWPGIRKDINDQV